jgi:hypothetical protein
MYSWIAHAINRVEETLSESHQASLKDDSKRLFYVSYRIRSKKEKSGHSALDAEFLPHILAYAYKFLDTWIDIHIVRTQFKHHFQALAASLQSSSATPKRFPQFECVRVYFSSLTKGDVHNQDIQSRDGKEVFGNIWAAKYMQIEMRESHRGDLNTHVKSVMGEHHSGSNFDDFATIFDDIVAKRLWLRVLQLCSDFMQNCIAPDESLENFMDTILTEHKTSDDGKKYGDILQAVFHEDCSFQDVSAAFDILDADSSGTISFFEFQLGIHHFVPGVEQNFNLEKFMEDADVNGDHMIDRNEFFKGYAAMFEEKHGRKWPGAVTKRYSSDKNGGKSAAFAMLPTDDKVNLLPEAVPRSRRDSDEFDKELNSYFAFLDNERKNSIMNSLDLNQNEIIEAGFSAARSVLYYSSEQNGGKSAAFEMLPTEDKIKLLPEARPRSQRGDDALDIELNACFAALDNDKKNDIMDSLNVRQNQLIAEGFEGLAARSRAACRRFPPHLNVFPLMLNLGLMFS